ncbi:adenosylcobinamide amidohydrolase [Nibricoccus sp. IMCC34717]|uniref:adenosylcobinamide amidohydrolase n=1 Tax=Nibricoccus sp. IMCC34717 TaxID=3034021 RepID=UPI00384EE4DB
MEDAPPALAFADSQLASWSRRGRYLVGAFKSPVRALSTCARNGGQASHLTHVVNHQSCEGAMHDERANFILGLGPEGYQAHVCTTLGLPAETTAVMGTAASMQYVGNARRVFNDIEVHALVTAGVSGNAGAAGDPAHFDEVDGKWKRVSGQPPTGPGNHHGTINTSVTISVPLTSAALARTVVMITEAKTAALMRLAIGSRQSRHLATGTGTDQFVVGCADANTGVRSWAGKHTKLGELLGEAVCDATLEALRWQNGLEPSLARSLFHALGRFGLKETSWKEAMRASLPESLRSLFDANAVALAHDPQVAAAVYGVAAVADRVDAGVLGRAAAREAFLSQAALVALAASGGAVAFEQARSALAPNLSLEPAEAELVPLVTRALAWGWERKWGRA